MPTLINTNIDEAFDEIELFGFPLCSPFALLKEPLVTTLVAADLKTYINKTVMISGYLITRKRTRTSKGDSMYFGTFVDTEGHWIDTVHFPPSIAQYPFTGPGCYVLKGKVIEEYDFICLEISLMKRLDTVERD